MEFRFESEADRFRFRHLLQSLSRDHGRLRRAREREIGQYRLAEVSNPGTLFVLERRSECLVFPPMGEPPLGSP